MQYWLCGGIDQSIKVEAIMRYWLAWVAASAAMTVFCNGPPALAIETEIECQHGLYTSHYRPGSRSGDGRSVYLPGGPPEDVTPQWTDAFPPPGYQQPLPKKGMAATIVSGEVLRRAVVVDVSAQRLLLRVEYYRSLWEYQLDRQGRVKNIADGRVVILGIGASILKSYKLWYTDWDLQKGWRIADELAP